MSESKLPHPGASGNALYENPVRVAGAPRQYIRFDSPILAEALPGRALELRAHGVKFELEVRPGALVEYVQCWELTDLELGDLASEISMAPGEELHLEVSKTTRTLVEQSREDVTQFEHTTESQETTRESSSIASVAARSSQWSASKSMSYSLSAQYAKGGLGASGNLSGQSQSNVAKAAENRVESRIEHIQESIKKASQKVTTQSKIAIRTVTETTDFNRVSRVIRNPAESSTLHIFAYEVFKKYNVVTWPESVVPILSLQIKIPKFDPAFVVSHAEFLQTVLDGSPVLESLGDARHAAARLCDRSAALTGQPEDPSISVLEQLLFENGDAAAKAFPVPTSLILDLDYPASSKEDTLLGPFSQVAKAQWDASGTNLYGTFTKLLYQGKAPPALTGVDEALSQHPSTNGNQIFLTWRYLLWLYTAHKTVQESKDPATLFGKSKPKPPKSLSAAAEVWAGHRQPLLAAFAQLLAQKFDSNTRHMFVDTGESTEWARRLDAFVLLNSVLNLANKPATTDEFSSPDVDVQERALSEVLAHLTSNAARYTNLFLSDLERRVGPSCWDTFVQESMHEAVGVDHADLGDFRTWYDPNRISRIGCELRVPVPDLAEAFADSPGVMPAVRLTNAVATHGGEDPPEEVLTSAAVAAKSVGMEANRSGSVPGLNRTQHRGSTGNRQTNKRGEREVSVAPKVVVRADVVRVLADGAHFVAGRTEMNVG